MPILSMKMLPFWLIPLAAFAAGLFTWACVLAQRRSLPLNRAFLWLTGFLSLWAFSEFLQWAPVPAVWLPVLIRIQPIFWLPLGFLFVHVVYVYLGRAPDVIYRLVTALVAISILLALTTDWVHSGYLRTFWGIRGLSGPLLLPLATFGLLLPVTYALVLILGKLRRSQNDWEKKRLRLLIAGALVTYLIGFTTNILLAQILDIHSVPQLGASSTAFFALFVQRAVLRHSFLTTSVEEAALQIFSGTRDGVLLLDGDRHILQANPAARRWLGLPESESFGQQAAGLLRPDGEVHADGSYEVKVLGPDQERILSITESQLGSLAAEGGRLVLVHDITERTKVDQERHHLIEQLRQAQKMEAMGRLAGGVAHDFNNLLSAILGYVGLLKASLGHTDERLADVEEIENAARRAAGLTGQLLAFSRRKIIKPEVLDLNDVVREMDKMLRRIIGEDVVLFTEFQPGLWLVEMDPGQFEQILLNVVVNARDAMPRGGILTIQTSNIETDRAREVLTPTMSPGAYVRISIEDNGIGMPTQVVEQIFEPFYTTKRAGKGTGLGLSTVYGITRQAGGEIQVKSEPGKGSTFDLYLPIFAKQAEATSREEISLPAVGGSETVMVVEDEPAVRVLISRILREKGYQVVDAEDGERALEVAGEHGGQIHLLLTDVIMPGMSGKELSERLRAIRPDLRVLYMSGYTEEVIEPHGVLADGTRLIQKPFEALDLLNIVRDVLSSHEAS